MAANRREFVQTVAWAALGGYAAFAVGACKKEAVAPVAKRPPAPAPDLALHYEFFTAAQYLTVAAACERILPKDHDPGANDLGAPIYIDRAFARGDYPAWAEPFRVGLALLDAVALRLHRQRFDDLDPQPQDAILADFQERGAPEERRFFDMLLHLTLEGAFSDPVYGGNIGGRGFDLVGFRPSAPMANMPHMHQPG